MLQRVTKSESWPTCHCLLASSSGGVNNWQVLFVHSSFIRIEVQGSEQTEANVNVSILPTGYPCLPYCKHELLAHRHPKHSLTGDAVCDRALTEPREKVDQLPSPLLSNSKKGRKEPFLIFVCKTQEALITNEKNEGEWHTGF